MEVEDRRPERMPLMPRIRPRITKLMLVARPRRAPPLIASVMDYDIGK